MKKEIFDYSIDHFDLGQLLFIFLNILSSVGFILICISVYMMGMINRIEIIIFMVVLSIYNYILIKYTYLDRKNLQKLTKSEQSLRRFKHKINKNRTFFR